jgi:hypothetical protein
MGGLISMGGGWKHLSGYVVCFFVMAACALAGVLLQLFTRYGHRHDPAHLKVNP